MRRVALVTSDFPTGGGTATMTAFLYTLLRHTESFSPFVVSLACSSSDNSSMLLRKPKRWSICPHVIDGIHQGIPFLHFGSYLGEIELMRYQPRRQLTKALAKADLIQVVAGSAAFASVIDKAMSTPLVLWIASTVEADRASRIESEGSIKKIWTKAMTRGASHMERQSLMRANHVFALSPYTRKLLKRWVEPLKLGVAPCGVDTTRFSPGRVPLRRYILSVGRFSDPRKNLSLLLAAYRGLLEQQYDAPELWLVDQIPTDSIHRMAELPEYRGKLKVLKPCRGESLQTLYRDALFFVLSSDEEGLGIVILEAMASGLAVVSTRCGGSESTVIPGATGLLTDCRNADMLRDALIDLTQSESLRTRLGQAGRKRAEAVYDSTVVGECFLKKYNELLN